MKLELKKHNIYVREDLVEINYIKQNIMGIDITNLKIFLDNRKNRSKISINSLVTDFRKWNKKIIHSDRDSAFANKVIFNYAKQNDFIVHLMSKKVFKHNASTETLNWWIKQKFYKFSGNKFENKESFYNL
ncbi:hypothetical protein SHELI_v1c09710 [Spiroplasma helicoides]|uniref:Uncharacterized protein n=1 Tax=Spiroplasma helicoides TaxID=216938 RepID=A0A1B3SLW1_9MOLU|nr:hypothetical protein [Spiroplasma helicoides]AOG60918.1 hypothetical protein SHELI_v1c09710 [Spiroplasma helicoides]